MRARAPAIEPQSQRERHGEAPRAPGAIRASGYHDPRQSTGWRASRAGATIRPTSIGVPGAPHEGGCTMIGSQDVIIALGIGLVLFGSKKLPELARGRSQSL